MSSRALSFVAVVFALVASTGVARAQDEPTPDAGPGEAAGDTPASAAGQVAPAPGAEVPEEYRQIDVKDVTFGMRDDHWSTIQLGADGTLYAGTYEGRAYISHDDAASWNESTVIPEMKEFYGFAGQGMYLGSLADRRESGPRPPPVAMFGSSQPASDRMLAGNPMGAASTPFDFSGWSRGICDDPAPGLGGSLAPGRGRTERCPGGGGLFDGALSLPNREGYMDDEAEAASGGAAAVLGVGLSNRAPRLSMLLAVRGRTVPNISLDRLLITAIQRPLQLRRIVPDPANAQHIFTATRNGLYESHDGGVRWMRTYSGATASERAIYEVAFDPRDPKRAYLGTERGMFMSDNGGHSWVKNGKVPDFPVRKVVIDQTDPRYVYAIGAGGIFRSNDRAQSFQLSYYSTQGKMNDVQWMSIDPFDPDTAYIGTGDGALLTHRARESHIADWTWMAPARTQGLAIPIVLACRKHRGHLFAMTRADLFTINYGSSGPENLVIESWDGGASWRDLLSNRTQGDLQWFTNDPRDPDVLWIAFSRALLRVGRAAPGQGDELPAAELATGDPTLTEVISAAQHYQGVAVDVYQASLDRLRSRAWIPSRLTVSFVSGWRNVGSNLDDAQFADDRVVRDQRLGVWGIMAWATWRLPSLIYSHDAVTMQRLRVQSMNDEVRQNLAYTVHRAYGELQRLKAKVRVSGQRDLYLRAIERVRIQQLETVVDLTTGGFLTRWKHKEKP